MEYPVVEIFNSIQGEGHFLGTPVTFIRLAGCNLGCTWCDTDYMNSINMSIEDMLKQINYHHVVITGGEPTIHNLVPLLSALREVPAHHIAIETNGTNSTKELRDLVDWITCSPKPQTNWEIHPECEPDEFKYVVDGAFDSEKHIGPGMRGRYFGHIWLQPESSQMELRFNEAFNMAMAHPYLRVGVQLHKILGVQ